MYPLPMFQDCNSATRLLVCLGGHGCQLEIERESIYPVFKVVLILNPPFLLVMPFYLSFL